LRTARRFVATALVFAVWACGSNLASGPSGHDRCWSLPGDGSVHAIAWTPDARSIWVLHGPSLDANRLSRIDATGRGGAPAKTYDVHGGAPLTVDDGGRPIWLNVLEEPAAVHVLDRDTDQVLGTLPRPGLVRLFAASATEPGAATLIGLEVDLHDQIKLVKLTSPPSFQEAPFGAEEESLIDAWVSTDGRMIGKVQRDGTERSVIAASINGESRQARIPGVVDGLQGWQDGRTFLFVADSAAVTSWNVDTGLVRKVTPNNVYAFAVSARGGLATARFTSDGPQLEVCVRDAF
jgi:hypothetical protein